jgi:hypothetical protein
MTTATLDRPARVFVRPVVTLALAAHREFTDVVVGLDLDDRATWAAADRSLARVSAEANDVVSALTGERWPVAVPGVPPVVRLRELSAAQRRLDAELDRWAGSERLGELAADLRGSATRVAESARWLGIVTASAADGGAMRSVRSHGVMSRRNIGRRRAGS